jgi:hypothetical protein
MILRGEPALKWRHGRRFSLSTDTRRSSFLLPLLDVQVPGLFDVLEGCGSQQDLMLRTMRSIFKTSRCVRRPLIFSVLDGFSVSSRVLRSNK